MVAPSLALSTSLPTLLPVDTFPEAEAEAVDVWGWILCLSSAHLAALRGPALCVLPTQGLPSGVSMVMQNSLLWVSLLFQSVVWSLAIGTKHVKVRRLEFAIVLVLFSIFPNGLCQICCSFSVPLHQVGTALWWLVEALPLPAFIFVPVFSSIVPLGLVQHVHVIIAHVTGL